MDELMVLGCHLLLRLNRHLVNVIRVNYHGRSMARNRRLGSSQLLLAVLFEDANGRLFVDAFPGQLRCFLWLGWINKLVGGLKKNAHYKLFKNTFTASN